MKNLTITIVAGARPNFMKIAPIIRELDNVNKTKKIIYYSLVHTGQHYDSNMSGSFFKQLQIPIPDVNLACGGGTQAEMTANIMTSFEKYLLNNNTNLVLVVGDVNSTLACSIVAKKLHIDVAHVEAGIRSYDRMMPEEINRLVTDSITDIFFTTTESASNNLIKSGIPKSKIYFVGNTMIDTLNHFRDSFCKPNFWDKCKITEKKYIVLTLHRPSNVDNVSNLKKILLKICGISKDIKIIFPIHPRTRKSFNEINIKKKNLIVCDPLAYLNFNYLIKNSLGVITDSGGITEEATVLNIPCITLRDSTERPETVDIGTNELIGNDIKKLEFYIDLMLKKQWKNGSIPKFWDGNTSKRIVKTLLKLYNL